MLWRKRTCLVLSTVFFILFIATTNYLMSILPSEVEVRRSFTIEETIYLELEKLPAQYHLRPIQQHSIVDLFVANLEQNGNTTIFEHNLTDIWKVANSWVSKNQVLNITSPTLGKVVFAMKTAKIIKADIDKRGTQLKLLLTLQGNQEVVFKPQWYGKEKVIEGPVYAGKDRCGSEIVGFYVSILLGKPLTPVSAERTILFKHDIVPVATKRLLDTTYEEQNKTCFYGECFFCKKEDPVCSEEKSFLNGAVIFNLRINLNNHRSPWQRTYKKGKNAVWQDFPETYCRTVKEKLSRKRIYDLIDLSIFDFLIQNGDRHHYETFHDTVLWLDNGKGFGNPFVHHLDILAPLYQCCMLRRETWKTLLSLTGGVLREKLLLMPDVTNVLTADHLKAMEERLLLIFATIEYCKHRHSRNE